jgi:hypothetical protein
MLDHPGCYRVLGYPHCINKSSKICHTMHGVLKIFVILCTKITTVLGIIPSLWQILKVT